MSYQRMSQATAFREIDTEEKARAWFWSERFGGKEFVCPECHEENSYWQDVRRPERRRCAVCGKEVRLRADGLLRDSKISLLTWVRGIVLITSDKRGVSALTLQRQLGLGSYHTAFLLAHKLRSAFGQRDEDYKLSGTVELDGSSIGSRKAENQAPVLVAIESQTYKNKAGRVRRKAGFAKVAIASETTENATEFLKHHVARDAMVNTDAASALVAVEGFDCENRLMKHDTVELEAWLPHVFRFMENAKAWTIGTFHGISKKYARLYMAEYTYRFNRRHDQSGLFHRALVACMRAIPLPARVLCA
jgi:ISXO2-like transposase domain